MLQLSIVGEAQPIGASVDSDVRYTPSHIIDVVRSGHQREKFDLDPCSDLQGNKTVQADTYYTKEMDGLSLSWYGSVWLNWPFSNPEPWMDKLIQEWYKPTCGSSSSTQSMSLNEVTVLARCDFSTGWAHKATQFFDEICHPKERIKFIGAGSSPDFNCILFHKSRDLGDKWCNQIKEHVGPVYRMY